MPVWTAVLAALLLGERLNQARVVMLVLGLAGAAYGPLPFFALDAQTRFDSERFAFDDLKDTFSGPSDPYANLDGRIGGWGSLDGQLTALVPLTPAPYCRRGTGAEEES